MGTVRNLWTLRRAHLWYQQGELLQPVMKVVAVGQTGLDCGGAVSPAHQQPHGVVSHWRETETGETAFFLCIRSVCVCFRSYCDYFCVGIQNNDRQMLTRINFQVLTFVARPVVRLRLQNSVEQKSTYKLYFINIKHQMKMFCTPVCYHLCARLS